MEAFPYFSSDLANFSEGLNTCIITIPNSMADNIWPKNVYPNANPITPPPSPTKISAIITFAAEDIVIMIGNFFVLSVAIIM